MDINKSIKIKNYNEYVKQKMPKSKVLLDCIKAFFVGGAICTVGQGLRLPVSYTHLPLTKRPSGPRASKVCWSYPITPRIMA